MNRILFELTVIFGLMLLNGIFAMAEFAIASARKGRLESEAKAGSKRANQVLVILRQPITFLATIQVGITVVGILAGVYGGSSLAHELAMLLAPLPGIGPYASEAAFTIVVLFITFLSVVAGEIIPKRIALAYPETLAKALIQPLIAFARLVGPFVWLTDVTTKKILKILPINTTIDTSVTEEEIRSIITLGAQKGVLEKGQEPIMRRVLYLSERSVTTLMTPRKDIIWLDASLTTAENWAIASEHRHRHFPVCRDSVDNLLGIISFTDFAVAYNQQKSDLDLTAHLRPPLKVPSTSTILRLIDRLKQSPEHFVVVIDEYGGVDGILTLHDFVGALIGELPEEAEDTMVLKRADGSLLVDARTDIFEIMELLKFPQSEKPQDYHSLGGFVIAQLGHIPREGESFVYEGYTFEIVDMDSYRIDKILISKVKE